MKINESWLREWINPSLNVQQLAQLLTMAGLEVESIRPIEIPFEGIIVGKILKNFPHPNQSELAVYQVSTGHNTISIISTVKTIDVGTKVALAPSGSKIDNQLIKSIDLEGELSEGKLCSGYELGFSDLTTDIWQLPPEAKTGIDLAEYMNLKDFIISINITPNRGDCLSVLGIARELAALTNQSYKAIKTYTNKATKVSELNICLKDSAACPIYYGRIIRNIDPSKKSPLWLTERLRHAGIRSINPAVDVTNYVMLEWGQPMHAFDAAKLSKTIMIRQAYNYETIELLNEQTVTLNDKTLVIADESSVLAIAGIMGGKLSAVNENSVDIFLESAFFKPLTIARATRHYNLQTDASQRFERGVDPHLAESALEYATYLLTNIVGGEIESQVKAMDEARISNPVVIDFRPCRVKALTSTAVALDKTEHFLKLLGMVVVKNNPDYWQVSVPSHRFDLNIEEDLVEEIIRLHGYDKLESLPMPNTNKVALINPLELLNREISYFLKNRNYQEIISYSFVEPSLQQLFYPGYETLNLINPISSELSQMQLGLWPGLVSALKHNNDRQQTTVKFFQAGTIFRKEVTIKEYPCIAGLVSGYNGLLDWAEVKRKYDFYDVKGDIQALVAYYHQEVIFLADTHSALHPGKTASLWINNQKIGYCGVLHPEIADKLKIGYETILFEIKLDRLNIRKRIRYQPISKFPHIRRDLSLLVDKSVNASQIEAMVHSTVPKELLKYCTIFDVYHDKTMDPNKIGLALAIIFKNDHRTMVDTEINHLMDAIIKKLNKECNIQLRE